MAQPHLAIADADKIHDYVFSPHELKLIRGGSRLQVILNRRTLKRLVLDLGGDCISANGGTVLAAFPDEGPASDFCRLAERRFLEDTRAATVSTEKVPFTEATFRDDRLRLLAKLERLKQCRGESRFHSAGAYVASCGACGLYAAARFDPHEDKMLCQACVTRQDHSDRGRTAPKDFGELGELSKPENYIAVVYIDVDGLGKFLKNHVTSIGSCRALSRRIDRKVRGSTLVACHKLPRIAEKDPFEILVSGGDDALVALPAGQAFPFLRFFQKEYQRTALWNRELPPFSAGVVIGHSHFPIAECVRIAEELLRSAKTVEGRSAVHYAVLTESMADRLVSGESSAAGRVTANPYEIEEFFRLLRGVQKLKRDKAPKSKIHSLYGMAHEGPLQAQLDYLYLLTRVEKKYATELLQPDLIGQELFRAGTTKAADLVELWDFIDADQNVEY